MPDLLLLRHLVVAGEPRQDGQAGSGRARPAILAQRAGAQVEDGAAAGAITGPVPMRVVGLVEQAGVAIERDRVAVAAGAGPALDGDVRREGIWAGIALARVQEGHRCPRL